VRVPLVAEGGRVMTATLRRPGRARLDPSPIVGRAAEIVRS
jgi:hypothetical protein